jgi:hypothetical protein
MDQPMALNRYGYVGDDPVNRTDPSGEYPFQECLDLLRNRFGLSNVEANQRCQDPSAPTPNASSILRPATLTPAPTPTSIIPLPSTSAPPLDLLLHYPFLSVTPAGSKTLSALTINRQKALSYAIFWSEKTNPQYPVVTGITQGADCTNFISQVMETGGSAEDRANGWYLDNYPDKNSTQSPSLSGCGSGLIRLPWEPAPICGAPWSATPNFRDYLVNIKKFSVTTTGVQNPGKSSAFAPLAYSPNNSNIEPADVAFFYQDCGTQVCPNHAAVIIGWGPPLNNGRLDFNAPLVPWIADHSGPGYMRPLNDISSPSGKIEIVHVQYP